MLSFLQRIFEFIFRLFYKDKGNASSQTCDFLDDSLNYCEECESFTNCVRVHTLACLSDIKIKEISILEKVWTKIKSVKHPSITGSRQMRKYGAHTNIGIHDNIWAEYGERFEYGYFIVPCCNVESVLTTKWSEWSVALLASMKKKYYAVSSYERVLFQLIYYKICISKQLLSKPIKDHMEYQYYFRSLKITALKYQFSVPNFRYLHDVDKITPRDPYELRVRMIIKNMTSMISQLGFTVILPFKQSPRIIKLGETSEFHTELDTAPVDWPNDELHNEITRYLPGQEPFHFNKLQNLSGKIFQIFFQLLTKLTYYLPKVSIQKAKIHHYVLGVHGKHFLHQSD